MSLASRILVLIACAPFWAAAAPSARSAGYTSRDQLRSIVQQHCLTHWWQAHDPSPCLRLTVIGHGAATGGFALLADRKGGAHFLLIPIPSMSGIESAAARAAGAPNYFEAAWQARDALAGVVGHAVPRAVIGMGVNPMQARSQDQLHIHIECLREAVYEALRAQAPQIRADWSVVQIAGWRYQALRIAGAQLGDHNPFRLLGERLGSQQDRMGQYTLLVAGMVFEDGPGFAVLAGAGVPPAERLLDPSCALAR